MCVRVCVCVPVTDQCQLPSVSSKFTMLVMLLLLVVNATMQLYSYELLVDVVACVCLDLLCQHFLQIVYLDCDLILLIQHYIYTYEIFLSPCTFKSETTELDAHLQQLLYCNCAVTIESSDVQKHLYKTKQQTERAAQHCILIAQASLHWHRKDFLIGGHSLKLHIEQ